MAEQNEIAFVGTNFQRSYQILQADETPEDITGWTVKIMIGTARNGSAAVTWTSGSEITIDDAANGQFSVDQAITLPAGSYDWQLTTEDTGTTVVRLHGVFEARKVLA